MVKIYPEMTENVLKTPPQVMHMTFVSSLSRPNHGARETRVRVHAEVVHHGSGGDHLQAVGQLGHGQAGQEQRGITIWTHR